MVRQEPILSSLLLIAAALIIPVEAWAVASARADRTTIGINESFQVTFETDQKVSDTPDFSPLERDFDILGTAQSTSINFVNGRMTRSATWVVDLMPAREGQLAVPAVTIGTESTNRIEITVLAAAPAGRADAGTDVWIEATVDNASPYVQEQSILTIRLLRRVPIGSASLSEPQVTGGDAVIEKLGDDVSYETDRDGSRVAVIERRYALFAQQSGRVVIEPLLFEGRVASARPFGLDPFARGRVIRARSEEMELNVKPVPDAFDGAVWLPAEQLTLVESHPDGLAELRVGEPFTRTLTLQASGLMASQLPEIEIPAPSGVKQYPDQPVLEDRAGSDGFIAARQEKVALIPGATGTITLPAIEIPWWNTRTDRLEVARLPERTLEVAATPGNTATAPTPTPQIPAPAKAQESKQSAVPNPSPGIWPWLTLLVTVAWLATLTFWVYSRRKVPRMSDKQPPQPNRKAVTAAIRSACAANDGEAAKAALLQWASLQWPGSRITSLGALAARLDGELQVEVHHLSQSLYRPGEVAWTGAQLWESFKGRRHEASSSGRSDRQLEPLYL